jgi:hypothetical protein
LIEFDVYLHRKDKLSPAAPLKFGPFGHAAALLVGTDWLFLVSLSPLRQLRGKFSSFFSEILLPRQLLQSSILDSTGYSFFTSFYGYFPGLFSSSHSKVYTFDEIQFDEIQLIGYWLVALDDVKSFEIYIIICIQNRH